MNVPCVAISHKYIVMSILFVRRVHEVVSNEVYTMISTMKDKSLLQGISKQRRFGAQICKFRLSICLDAFFPAERLLRSIESPVETYCERGDDERHTQKPERNAVT